MEREYPLVLRLTHILPLGNGLLGGICTLVIVTDDTAQQSVVANGNPVMVVQRYAGQCRDIDLVFQCIVYLLGQQRVQCMDTLDNQHGIVRQLQLLTVPFPLTRHKVIFWNLHALALHQSQQMFFQQRIFHRFYVVEVIITIGQLGCIYAIHEIIVGRKRHGAQSAGQQLDGQTFAEGGLTRTRRSCYQDHTHRILLSVEPAVYFLGYLHYLLFLQSLTYLNEFRSISTLNGFVHIARIRQSHDDVPACFLCKHLEGLGLFHLFCQSGGVVPVGHAQQ